MRTVTSCCIASTSLAPSEWRHKSDFHARVHRRGFRPAVCRWNLDNRPWLHAGVGPCSRAFFLIDNESRRIVKDGWRNRSRILRLTAALWCAGAVTVTVEGDSQCKLAVPADMTVRIGTATSLDHTVYVIAFGTSLMWGNGLKERDTFRYLVADWLATNTSRAVLLTTYAHSAAVLKDAGDEPMNPAPTIGDLNNAVPSVDQQIECAALSPSRGGPLSY